MIEKIELIKPLLVNGKRLKTLTYDLQKISMSDLAWAQSAKGKLSGIDAAANPQIAQTDPVLHICLTMAAIMKQNPEIDENDLFRLEGYDLTQLMNAGVRFFIKPDAPTSKNSEESPEVTPQDSSAQ